MTYTNASQFPANTRVEAAQTGTAHLLPMNNAALALAATDPLAQLELARRKHNAGVKAAEGKLNATKAKLHGLAFVPKAARVPQPAFARVEPVVAPVVTTAAQTRYATALAAFGAASRELQAARKGLRS